MRTGFLILIMIICSQVESYATLHPETNEFEKNFLPEINFSLTTDEFLKLKPSDIKKLTGKRLALKELFALKFAQAKIKMTLRKNKAIDKIVFYNEGKKPFKWHWGGFFWAYYYLLVSV